MFRYLPQSRTLRAFVLQIYRLFDPDQSPHQAACRRAALVKDPRYRADPDLAKVLGMLSAEKFDKMMAFLHSPVAERVRTNNHVERTNRRLRTSRRCGTSGVGGGPSSGSSSWLWIAGITSESPKNNARTPDLGSHTHYYPANRQPDVVASSCCVESLWCVTASNVA
jgi:hypothetical protein